MTIEHHKSIKINVVIPSHVRALATDDQKKFCAVSVVIPSHVRALATMDTLLDSILSICCHTLSCEGVSNLKCLLLLPSVRKLSYPLM